jgi:predicted  nucleic acid-binding Zn-ribbon protein
MNESIHLFRLQKVDTQIDQITSRLNEIKRQINSNQTIKDAENISEISLMDLENSRKNLKSIEDEIQSLRNKLEMCDSSLYSGKIKNPKELSDLQIEIASIKKHISRLEEKQLEALYALEFSETTHNKNIIDLQKVKNDFTSLQEKLKLETSQLIATRDSLVTEKEAVTKSISSASLHIYDQLRSQKRGVAVTTTREGACTGCGSSLRPAELQDARATTQLYYCSSCGRIIYVGS